MSNNQSETYEEKRFGVLSEKEQYRQQLEKDMEDWLAQGNQIEVAPPAFNCRDDRRVRAATPYGLD